MKKGSTVHGSMTNEVEVKEKYKSYQGHDLTTIKFVQHGDSVIIVKEQSNKTWT